MSSNFKILFTMYAFSRVGCNVPLPRKSPKGSVILCSYCIEVVLMNLHLCF